MVKAITSPRDVKYSWREERKAYRFDFRPFGAGRPHFNSKTEGLNKAKELIEAMRCKVAPGAKFEVREPWTLGEAFEHFKDHCQRRVDDPDARFGAATVEQSQRPFETHP